MTQPTPPQRFEALDAWRGICALVVALVHLPTESVLHRNAFVMHGYRFVDFFFVLSGFVIAHAYRDRLQRGWTEIRVFLIRRLGRLWPLHALVLFAFVGIQIGIFVAGKAGISIGHGAFAKNTVASIPANLALVHAWGMYDTLTWNAPSWSISTEVAAYGLFAAVCALVPERWIGRVAALIALGAMLVIAFIAPAGMKSMFDYALFRCFYGFMTGVLVRSAWTRFPVRLGTVGELALIATVVAAVSLLPTDAPALLVTPLFGVVVWGFASESGAVSAALRCRWAQTLGAWSYSIYMLHPLVTAVVMVGLGKRLARTATGALDGDGVLLAAITLGYVAIVVALASITYRHVELRGQRIFNRWAKPPPR